MTDILLSFFMDGMNFYIGKFMLPVLTVACVLRLMVNVFPADMIKISHGKGVK